MRFKKIHEFCLTISFLLIHWSIFAQWGNESLLVERIIDETETDSLFNPFTLYKVGIPFFISDQTLDMADTLNNEEISQSFKNAFEKEEISMQSKYLWKGDSGTVFLDSYDEKSKIGYVFLDSYELGKETLKSWFNVRNDYSIRYKTQSQSLQDNFNFRHINCIKKVDLDELENELTHIIKTGTPKLQASYKELINHYKNGECEKINQRNAEKLYLEYRYLAIYDSCERYCLPVRNFVQRILDTQSDSIQADLIHRFGLLYSKGLLFHTECNFSQEVQNNIDLQQKILFNLVEQPNFDNIDSFLLKMSGIRKIFSYKSQTEFMRLTYAQLDSMQHNMDWEKIDAIIETSKHYVADLDEIEEIASKAHKNGQFIIVYARHPFSVQAFDSVHDGKFRADAILALEDKVRMYIRWAKRF
jgi:hypothetical protein